MSPPPLVDEDCPGWGIRSSSLWVFGSLLVEPKLSAVICSGGGGGTGTPRGVFVSVAPAAGERLSSAVVDAAGGVAAGVGVAAGFLVSSSSSAAPPSAAPSAPFSSAKKRRRPRMPDAGGTGSTGAKVAAAALSGGGPALACGPVGRSPAGAGAAPSAGAAGVAPGIFKVSSAKIRSLLVICELPPIRSSTPTPERSLMLVRVSPCWIL